MEPPPKQLVVLVGPKGSGKTTLGRMLEQSLGARFVGAPRRGIFDELETQAAQSDLLVIESTGESEDFFDALRERYELLFVRVHAERTTCDARTAEPEPDAELRAHRYERSSSVPLLWDLELDNNVGLDMRTVVDAVRPLLRN